MTDFDPDAKLRARVQAALTAAESARPPAFEALWRAAQSTPGAASAPARWRPALAATVLATVAAAGLVALLLATRAPRPLDAGPDADLLLAQELTASDPWRVPTDALLDAAPASLTRGAPPLPDFRYPLLPEERFL